MLSFIVENKTETDLEGNVTEINDFDDYIEDILSAVQPDGNLKKKAYKFLDDKFAGKKIGFFVKDDWESDEV